ncbi:MAG: hypothetical protein JWM82_2043 [Myxococcales bacterium]|jgi:hypothetical protein|nr:hypothetical protein [Myxococcales bacterium]
MKNLSLSLVTAFALTALSSVALAKGGTPQNHHCMKDGAELAGKTKKDCKKEGGKWDKIAADAAKPAADGKAADAKPADAKAPAAPAK